MSDNQYHEMRLVHFGRALPRYPTLMCAYCLRFLQDRMRCSACKKAYYCSKSCQEEDWPAHRRVCGQDAENKPCAYCFVQLPCPVPCMGLQPAAASCARHVVRFFCDIDEIYVTFGSANCVARYQDRALRVARLKGEQEGGPYSVELSPAFDGSRYATYARPMLECSACRGAAAVNAVCAKCGAAYRCDERVVGELYLLWENALMGLLGIEKLKTLADEYFPARCALSNEEFLDRTVALLKQNIFHHLCLPVLHLAMRILQLLYRESDVFRTIRERLGDFSIFGVCFACLKGALFHYGICDQTFKTLLTATRMLNFYTLNEMEARAPACMREFNENVHQEQRALSDDQLAEIRRAAFPLLKEHENAMEFARYLVEMSQKIGDERIILECENLLGQMDCRLENLESWVYDEEDDVQDMCVRGREVHSDADQPGASSVSLL